MIRLDKAICVHAFSSDLRFLTPVKNRLAKVLGDQMRTHILKDPASHTEAILSLARLSSGLAIIFAHGSGDYIKGGEYRSRTGENLEVEKFITGADLSMFKGMAVFCMSCDSNGLAQRCIEAGALCFVGFDKIPFNVFDGEGDPIGSHVLVQHCQGLITDATKACLERFVTGAAALDECVDFLRLWIDKHAIDYVRRYKAVKERRNVAALFLRVRAGVRYHGVKDIQFGINK